MLSHVVLERKIDGYASPRTYARNRHIRPVFEAVNMLSGVDLIMLESVDTRTRCFCFAAAMFHSKALRRCVRAADINDVINVIGPTAFEYGLNAETTGDVLDTEADGRVPLAQALDRSIDQCEAIWRASLPLVFQENVDHDSASLSAADKELDVLDERLAECLAAEITRLQAAEVSRDD